MDINLSSLFPIFVFSQLVAGMNIPCNYTHTHTHTHTHKHTHTYIYIKFHKNNT